MQKISYMISHRIQKIWNRYKTALLFYSHLNQLDNDFLEDHNYSREEIVSGVKDVLNRYHLDSMSALF